MQTKTGIIKMIQPNGGYDSQYGYVNTFMMTIEVPNEGQITGEIGSKSVNYPLNLGEQITFQMKNTEHGWKFKKVNPQYQQGGSQATGRTNGQQRDYDAENRGKCRTQFIKAAIIAGTIPCRDFAECDMLVQYAMTGKVPAVKTEQVTATPTLQGKDTQVYSPPPDGLDDIPF